MRTMAGLRDISRERSARLETYVPVEHPLRRVRSVIDAPLGALHQWLRAAGTPEVRCSIGPEQMVRALLLQFLFVIRRDRQLVDQIWYSMLFRWFVGLRLDEPKWELESFATFRQQLLKHDIIREVLLRGLSEAHREGLLSAEALTSRRCELAQFTSEVTVGVGRPGVLPSASARSVAQGPRDCSTGVGCAPGDDPR
jgi:transposase